MGTKTLGLNGLLRDFTTLAAWASYANSLNLTADEFLEVYNDGGPVADTGTVTVSGWVHNGFTVTMRPAAGQGFKDHVNHLTNPLRWDSSVGAALTNSMSGNIAYIFSAPHFVVQDLQFKASNAGTNGCIQSNGGLTINRCILYAAAYYAMPQSSNATINDSLLMTASGGSGGIQVSGDSLVVNNCTFASVGGSGVGIRQTYTQSIPPLVKNSVFYNFGTDVQGNCASGTTNNATSSSAFGGTGWGTAAQVNVTASDFENVTAGSEDFRTKATSTKLIDTGAAGVGTGLDIVGSTRSGPRNIGAWELGASAPNAPTTPTTTSVTSTSAVANWVDASGDETGFRVELELNLSGTWTLVNTTAANATSQALSSLTTGATYRWRVRAENGSGNSAWLTSDPVYPGTWRPAVDVTVTGWTVTGAATHAAALNENSPGSASEYVTSPPLSPTPVFEVIDLDRSMPAGTYTVDVTAQVPGGSGFVRITMLNASNVSQGVSPDQAITGTLTNYSLTITTTGAATRYKVETWN